ncbi:MAG: hypothetical protein RLY18_474, partial [Pseudomonadota bacterium]
QMRGGFTADEYDEELAFVKQQLEQDAKQGKAPWPEYLASFSH